MAIQPKTLEISGTYTGGAITTSQVEERGFSTLLALRQEVYETQAKITEDLAFERLLESEASRRGIPPKEVVRLEVDAKIIEPTAEAYAEARKEIRRVRQLPKDENLAKAEVLGIMRQRDWEKRFEELRHRLLEAGGFQLSLDPPRSKTPIYSSSPVRGPKDAPITLVEFSDFQCPHCKTAQATVRTLWELYPSLIRHVYKYMPVDTHPQAKGAAEAGAYAAKMGKFWSYRTLLHASADDLSRETLLKRAGEIDLDVVGLSKSLDAHAQTFEVERDMADAAAMGIDGAPVFLVNGRLLKGAPPLETLAKIINDELRRAGIPLTPEQVASAAGRTPAR